MSGRQRESIYDSRDVVRGPSFGGVGHRMSIVGPHAAAAVIDDNDDDSNDRRRSGGGRAHPLLSVPSHQTPSHQTPSCRMPLVIVDVANRSQWRWHEGVRGVVIRVVEEEGPHCCTHSSGSDPTRGGRWGEEEWRDVGGITWQTSSGWGRRRRRRRKGNGDDNYGYMCNM